MSRRSPKHWNGAPAGRTWSARVECTGTEQWPHKKRLVGKIGWKRDDIDPEDPRWEPEGGVLYAEFGQIARYGVLLMCPDCPDEGRLFMTPEQFHSLARHLSDQGESRVRFADVGAILAKQ